MIRVTAIPPPRDDTCWAHLTDLLNFVKHSDLPDVDLSGFAIDTKDMGANRPHMGVEGGSTEEQFNYLVDIAKRLQPKTICQTGLNYGTSALAFLCGGRAAGATVYSWDLGEHGYVRPVVDYLRGEFGADRVQYSPGDSTRTLQLPAVHAHFGADMPLCDLIFVDGGHFGKVPFEDMKSFQHIAKPGAVVLVDDCNPDVPIIHDVTNAWLRAREEGILDDFTHASCEVGAGSVDALRAVLKTKQWGVRDYCLGRYRPLPGAAAAAGQEDSASTDTEISQRARAAHVWA